MSMAPTMPMTQFPIDGETVHYLPSRADATVVARLRNLYISARQAKRARYDTWVRNYRLVQNQLGGTSQSNWMPSPRDSEIYPTLSSIVAWMTDQDLRVTFYPAADPESKSIQTWVDLASDLSDIIYTNWNNEYYGRQIDMNLWDALIYGTGIIKSCWDNEADDGFGNATIRRIDPWRFYPDPYCSSVYDAEYLCETYRVPYEVIERRWPDRAHLVRAGMGPIDQYDTRPETYTDMSTTPMTNPGSIPMSGTYGDLGASGFGNFARPNNNKRRADLPMFVVYEFWFRQNTKDEDPYTQGVNNHDSPLTDRYLRSEWRVVILCNDVILMDEPAHNIWSHGQHPYADFRFDDLGEFWGISLVDHLAHPQIYINRLLTALQHNAELTGNPILVEAKGSGTTRIPIINRPGQRIQLDSTAAMQNAKPFWLQPPAMPQQVVDLVQFWISRIENTSGLSALQKGAAPNQRNAENVVNAVQEAAFVRIRHAMRAVEWQLRSIVEKTASLICDNFTEQRIMSVIGQDGEQTALTLDQHHFYSPSPMGQSPLKFGVTIEAGASGPTSRQARIAEGDRLFSLGVVDDTYLLNLHRVKGATQILTRLYTKRQAGVIGGGPGQRQRAGRA